MKYTQNYNFRKPEDTDPADIQDLNYNADAIDGKLKEIEDWEAAHLQASNPHNITPALIGAETPTGAQQKANQAETNAKSYADTVANSALNSAKDYADDVLESANSHTDQVASDLSQKLNETRIKVLDVEQDVSNISKVLTNLNPNQEPKQQATGYGIVSLPKNAANGQVSGIEVKGLTATNLVKNGDFRNGIEGWINQDFDYELIDGNLYITTLAEGHANRFSQQIYVQKNHKYFIKIVGKKISGDTTGILITSVDGNLDYAYTIPDNNIINFYTIKESTATSSTLVRLFRTSVDASIGDQFMINYIMMIDLTALGLENKTADEINEMFPYYFEGTKSTISAMRLKSVSADETETSTAYVVAKDEEGNIAELRSLPNGTKDEVRVSENKLIKRIGDKTNVASGTVIDYSDMADNGTYYAWNDDGETETGVKGDTLTITATTLIYQLATPIEIPIQTSGSLVSYPSGTVYIEPFVADAGIYTDKMEVLHQDLPIKALEKLSKIDFTTGLETELDVSDAVIAENKLSFTHPDLVDGDIVFFTYEYDRESTEGETEIEYYDSRYVIKDSVTEKFYKWHIAVADGVPSIELVEV